MLNYFYCSEIKKSKEWQHSLLGHLAKTGKDRWNRTETDRLRQRVDKNKSIEKPFRSRAQVQTVYRNGFDTKTLQQSEIVSILSCRRNERLWLESRVWVQLDVNKKQRFLMKSLQENATCRNKLIKICIISYFLH